MKKIYNVLDYGAIPNHPDLQTEKLQAAIDACFLDGGGEVVIPVGTFRTATIRVRSNITLHLLTGAILEGSQNPDDYRNFLEDKLEPMDGADINKVNLGRLDCPWFNAIIRGYKAENIRIIGDPGSCINGMNCYDPEGEEKYRGPHAIHFLRCQNLEFSGYTIQDSANWAHILYECRNIYAHNLTVMGGHDGFHTRVCDNVCIEDCQFYTGDDCIAGYDIQNMVVRNCLLDCGCSAMRLGGTDILIDHCTTHAPSRYGFRGSLSLEEKAASAPTNPTHRHSMHTPFLYFCDKPTQIRKTPGNIIVQNCTFENPHSFFRLWFDGKHRWCCNRSLSSILFRNCVCTGVTTPIDLYCTAEEPTSFRLENVQISPRKGYENIPFMRTCNCAEIIFDNVTAPGYTTPTIQTSTDGKMTLRNSDSFQIETVKEF